jgi:hypothetical protein
VAFCQSIVKAHQESYHATQWPLSRMVFGDLPASVRNCNHPRRLRMQECVRIDDDVPQFSRVGANRCMKTIGGASSTVPDDTGQPLTTRPISFIAGFGATCLTTADAREASLHNIRAQGERFGYPLPLGSVVPQASSCPRLNRDGLLSSSRE